MMKRLLIVAVAALALGCAVNKSHAQALTKICFPAETGTGKAPSCRDVTLTNPLPTTATLSAAGGINVTVTNTTGTPVIVSSPNGFGGGTVTVQNFSAGSSLNVLDTNSAAILSAVQAAIPAGTNLIGKVGIDQTTPGPGGTNDVTAGASFLQSLTPTIQASAYAAGNCIGGFNAITIVNYNGESGFLTNFRVTSLAGNTAQLNIYLFDSNPTTSTCTDKGAFTLSAADVDKLITNTQNGTLATSTGAATPSNISADLSPPRPFIAGGSTASGVRTIFFGLQAATALTPASTTDLHVRAGAALN